jgi:hypothetical protein
MFPHQNYTVVFLSQLHSFECFHVCSYVGYLYCILKHVCLLIVLALPGLASKLRADCSTAVLRHRKKCEIRGSHGGVCEECHLLECEAIQSAIRQLTNVLPRVVRQENTAMGPEELETKNE